MKNAVLLGSALLAGASGLLFGISAFLIMLPLKADLYEFPTSLFVLTSVLATLAFTFNKGLVQGLGAGVLVLIPTLLLSTFSDSSSTDIGANFFIGGVAIFCTTTGLGTAALVRLILFSLGYSTFVIYVILSCLECAAATYIFHVYVFVVVSLLVIASNFVSHKSIYHREQFRWLWEWSIKLSAIRGTSFYQANLAEANFLKATLKHACFEASNLTQTYWRDAKGLEFARLGNTYLANPKIRQLVVTCNGQGQNFDGLDLTGVNLQGANLQDASFISTNLNQSNLRDADLSRAILKQTQLDETDLTGAILTAACIEDWGMTSTTKLENVQCDYVYVRLPTPEKRNPLRKPDDERKNFSEGEFADFNKPYFDTLDLYHGCIPVLQDSG
jgi:uncharacterized protein YjbI with pentapeptide repeats